MATRVVVLGAGYAGAGAINSLQKHLPERAELTWIAENDYHFVLHESHRIIRDAGVQDKLTIPVAEIADPETEFVQGEVVDVDVDERVVELADESTVDYDYVLVAIGSETATYGIDGMAEHPLTLKSREDALEIHEQVREAARDATRDDPAQVVIGGAGLSGIQSAGEVAEFRDENHAPIDVTLVEALPEIFPPGNAEIQGALRHRLEQRDIDTLTDDPITAATADHIEFDERDDLDYDVFLWTGGVTGPSELSDVDLEKEHNRLNASSNLRTEDERVFAIGDNSLVDQGENPAPPTAQAAWQSADVVGKNIAAAIEGRPLERWTYDDQGTLISIGEEAVAHQVSFNGLNSPIETFGGPAAKNLKKAAAARWINKITGPKRVIDAWGVL
ncbi:LOW QUALITY PROTEIN: NADH dehydrogenase [Halarchaeum acidiphilum MH1-52-1]|uniref:NADH dehydrogenase n=1 Tax=Halarchaeum acidiphilum MH1-52-1 TaxID=1261545 RepID=U2YGR9_9EURY|nr:LOW QUALITY PROTEIN: NADH dehydrogenase [Halarchaeum acidiphilum MH1-52-1]